MLNFNNAFDFNSLSRTLRANSRRSCPVCHENRSKCAWKEDSLGTWRIAWCVNEASDKPGGIVPGGYQHLNFYDKFRDNNVTIADLRPATPAKLEPLAPELVDKINRRILELCPLSSDHAAYLIAEGVSSAGCGSFKRSETSQIARQLVAEFGESSARRHPALVQLNGKSGSKYWALSAFGDGLLLPAHSVDDLVLGLQIRHDHSKGKNDRYKWLGHDGLAGTPLSIFKAAEPTDLVIISEGFKKCAVAARHWKCAAISLAGVSSYKQADLLAAIDELGAGRVALAFDQDKRANSNVQRAETELIELLPAARPGLRIEILQWDVNQGKGLDDAAKTGATFTFEPATKGSKVVHNLPLEAHQRAFGGVTRPIYTLEQARQEHAKLFSRLLNQKKNEQIALTSVTGTGKSTSADNAAASEALAGTLNKKTTIFASNTANLKERTQPGTLLGKAVQAGVAVIQQGRNVVDHDNLPLNYIPTNFDCHNPEASQAGQARHIPAKIVCSECPFGSAENWKKAHPEDESKPGDPRPWRCEEEGYLASRKRSEKAQLVVATKESYLNGSKSLLAGKEKEDGTPGDDGFEVVICDEDFLPKLMDTIELGAYQIQSWRESIKTRNLAIDPQLAKLFDVLETTLKLLADRYPAAKAGTETERTNTLFPVMDVLAEAAQKEGVLAETFLAQLPQPDRKNDTYEFELHYRREGKLKIPFRALADFLDALAAGDLRVKARRQASGNFTFSFTKIKKHLVDYLNQVTLVVLDATLPPNLKALFPAMKEISFDVPQSLEIWQTTNSMYTSRGMYNEKTRADIEAAAAHFFTGANRPLAFVPMRFENEFKLGNATVSHWGRHKATNEHIECDSLVLTGHYVPPIAEIKAEIDTLRAYGFLPPEPAAANQAGPEKLRLYNYAENGLASGRWCKADADPALQEAIEADYAANIIQAIGRLRAALRPANHPARVLILCSEPVGNLKIDHLTTVKDLLKEAPPVYAARPEIIESEVVVEEEKIHTPPKSTFLLINSISEMEKSGGMYSGEPEPQKQQNEVKPKALYNSFKTTENGELSADQAEIKKNDVQITLHLPPSPTANIFNRAFFNIISGRGNFAIHAEQIDALCQAAFLELPGQDYFTFEQKCKKWKKATLKLTG